LTTHGWKTGKEHRIEIWFVEHNKRYYIISERLDSAHWVQNIKHNPTAVSFSINDKVFKGDVRIVDQERVCIVCRSFEINGYKIQMESGTDCRAYANKFKLIISNLPKHIVD
jgi:hypothetical protein